MKKYKVLTRNQNEDYLTLKDFLPFLSKIATIHVGNKITPTNV